MAQAETAPSTFASAENAAEIAAKNDRARLSIGREIEALLRIRREADATAARLITLLDLDLPDPDLEDNGDEEPTLGWAGAECNGRYRDEPQRDGEGEPSLGWTSTINQTSRHRLGRSDDVEYEHDGREPDVNDENGHDMEDCAVEYHGGDEIGAGATL